MAFINELSENEEIYEQLLVVQQNKCMSNNGAAYLNITLQDKTGTLEGKVWSATPYDIDTFQVGNVVKVHGIVNIYKDKLQLKILDAEKVDKEKADPKRFAQEAPLPLEEMETDLKSLINKVKDEEYHTLLTNIFKEVGKDYVLAPAATRNHHEYMSGLIHHSVSMAKLVDMISDFYLDLDKDILITGALIHDIGKIKELSGPIAPKYTLEGKLVGHISIMHAYVNEKCKEMNMDEEKRILIEHMILSHHGKYEFGSPVLPLTKEALILNMVDDMDAKLNTLNKELAITKPGEFTQKIFPLDDRYFYKPKNSK